MSKVFPNYIFRYLLRRLLQQEAKTGGGGSQVASTAKPSSSTSPVGNTALPGKHTTQSIAQILGEVEKRKRKVSGSGGGASALTKKKLGKYTVTKEKKGGSEQKLHSIVTLF